MQTNEVGYLPKTIYKNLTQMDQRPNVRPKTIKRLEENIEQKLHNIGFGKNFLAMPSKAQVTKEKK